MRHIVFVNLGSAFGGREKRLIDWLRFVDHSRVRTTIVARTDVYSGLLKKYRIPTAVKATGLELTFSLVNLYKWLRFLRELKPDQILCMQGDFFEIPFFLVLVGFAVAGGAVSMSEHLAAPPPEAKSIKVHFKVLPGLGLWWYRQRALLTGRYLLARKVIAVSESVKQGLTSWGCPGEKISVIRHGFDVQLFRPSEEERAAFREGSGIPRNAVVLLSTARLERVKRLERLIRAFNCLSERRPDLWLVFAGDGSLRAQLAEDVQNRKRVLFLGHVSEEQVAKALKASDIYVLPSDNEGSPMALIEAMAAGLLCIATNVPGPRDIIQHGTNGFLVDPSEGAILSMIEEVLGLDSARARQIGANAISSATSYEIAPAVADVLSILSIPSILSLDATLGSR